MLRRLLCAATVPLLLSCRNDATQPSSDRPVSTFLRFRSDSGDWVGGGTTRIFTAADGAWFIHTEGASDQTVVNQVSFFARNDTLFWSLDFAAPAGEPMAVGTYENAQRFNSLTQPNLQFMWSGSGCNVVTGRFEVLYLETTGRTVDRVHATFEQHCEGAPPALRGEVSYVRPTTP